MALAVLVAGALGHLTPAGAAAVVAAAAVVGLVLVRRRGAGADAGAPSRARGRAPREPAEVYLVLAAVAGGAAWLWPHLVDATRLWIWDDYTYHMVYPALWLREHAIRAVPPEHAFTMQAWYPLGASLVAAWYMLPFAGVRGDALAWVSLTGPL